MEFKLNNEFKDAFQQAIEAKDTPFIESSLKDINPLDITSLLDEFSAEECKFVLHLLPAEIGATVLESLDDDIRKSFIQLFSSKEMADYLTYMDSDDATDFLYEIPVEQRNEVIRNIDDEEKASHILELLKYDEEEAGGMMAKELIKMQSHWTIQRCIVEIRKQAESVEKIYSVYVVDKKNVLVGVVELKKIIVSPEDAKIIDVCDQTPISVEASTPEDEVISIIQKYDLVSVPVVNARSQLVGRITIDDVIDVLKENVEEERQLMAGVSADIEEDDSIWKISKARLPWLIIGMIGGMVGAKFMGLFQEEIVLVPALAFFIPLVTASGGNVGIQSSAIIVQSLANPNAFEESNWERFLKLFTIAILNGLILSVLVYGGIWFIMNNHALATTVSIALFAVVFFASFIGTYTPLILSSMGFNPALAVGPFLTTANDLLGIVIYFWTASVIYNL